MEENNDYSLEPIVSNIIVPKEEITAKRAELKVDLPDVDFLKIANKLIKDSKDFFDNKYDLTNKRQRNEKFLFGRQLDGRKFKKYNSHFVDNILWEGESYIKPMSLSRLPDVVVNPGQLNDESENNAKLLSKVLSTDLKTRERRKVLSLAFKHHPVYYIGIIKVIWNPERGPNGDFEFKVVHPENVIMDHRATTSNTEDMDFIAENIEYTVKEWIMHFPDKKEEFLRQLELSRDTGKVINEADEGFMSSKVKGWELWFTYFNKKGDSFERQECVGWFYKDCVFKVMKDPNWDWEGEQQSFNYNTSINDESTIKNELLQQNFMGVQTQQIFRNFFDNPQKPYIFITYDQWGKIPLDETSRIEQAIPIQEDYDKRGQQITEMLDRAKGKHVWSGESGLKGEDVEEMDPNDPDEDLFLKNGDVSKVHDFIPGEQPSSQMIQDKQFNRERIFDKMGVHGPARGEVDGGETATTNQLSREGDFTRNDDLTEDTINAAAELMAKWELQLIKLRYSNDHMRRVLGDDGKELYEAINRDLVQDGMEVEISASGTDKLKAEQRAMDMAKLKLIDPMSFYTDMNMSDPKGRTEKLILFLSSPELYLQKFASNPGDGTAQMLSNNLAATQNGQSPQGGEGQPQDGAAQGQGGDPQALQDIMQIQQGIVPPVPNVMSSQYIETFTHFMNDPNGAQEVLQQFPQIKEQLLQFAQAVSAKAKEGAQPQPNPATPPSGQPPVGDMSGVGPTGQGPSPANPGQVATGGAPSMV